MRTKHLIISILLALYSISGFSQNCSEYHINKCRWTDDSFLYSRQSRSALYIKGMTSEFSITVYGGEEYYISVKGDRQLGDIRIRVKEDNQDKTLLYDNAEYEYEDFFFFKNEVTRNLILQISSEARGKFSNSSDRYCLGVLIEFRAYKPEKPSKGF